MSTTHGNVITHRGACHVCGREDVDLKTVTLRGERSYSCADEFACFAAWQASA